MSPRTIPTVTRQDLDRAFDLALSGDNGYSPGTGELLALIAVQLGRIAAALERSTEATP